jgi:hypothetical protein
MTELKNIDDMITSIKHTIHELVLLELNPFGPDIYHPAIDQLEEVSEFLSQMRSKINKADELTPNETKINIAKDELIFEGKMYPVTPKMKCLLMELSNCVEWTTAKKLSEPTHESEGYISSTLFRLMNRGFPIASYISSGKRYWMLKTKIKEKNGINIAPE